MKISRVMEYVFFFGLLAVSGYMVWLIMQPFLGALALSAIIVTICSPLYERVLKHTPKKSRTAAAFFTTILVLVLLIIPIVLITSLVAREMASFYADLTAPDDQRLAQLFAYTETKIRILLPEFEINATDQLRASGEWIAQHLGAIFAGTLSTIFVFFISILGSFYFFRDGKELMQILIKASPLPDKEDEVIFNRMARAVRAVATGTLFLAMIQGFLVTIGFFIFGIERPILWGLLAAFGALMPGIGTTIVTAPAIIYLFLTGHTVSGVGLLVWSVLIVGLVDNIAGPYLMGRGNNMHPFVILISVIGGIALFGPLGFIVGPVVVTLFFVLLEIYNQYIVKDKPVTE